MPEILFSKYKTRGPGYHWGQISWNAKKRNLFTLGLYKMIVRKAGEINDKKILDIGCGDGVLTHMLASCGSEVTGLDSSEEAISFARDKTRGERGLVFQVGDAYKLPFDDGKFDIVVSSELIEHLQNPTIFLKEISRVWNGNGPLIISTPIKLTKTPSDHNHVREYFFEEFKAMLQEHFTLVEVEKSHPVFWKEFHAKKIFQKRLPMFLLNCFNMITGFNPFLTTKNWNYWSQQIAVIKKSKL